MNTFFTLIFFITGTLIGSFLNVCIFRIPREESIAFPPSHCTKCSNKIKAYDLVPIISWIFLKGKCRHCGEKISIKYPLVEGFTGVMFTFIYLEYGLTLLSIKYCALVIFLIVIAIIDFETTDVYTSTTWSGIAVGIIFTIVSYIFQYSFLTYIYGALALGGIFALIVVLTGGMGWGDVEIAVLCGIFLGLKLGLLMVPISFIIGAAVGLILIGTKKKTKKDYIPFGPYLAIGSFIVMFFGEKIIEVYLKIFF